MANDGDTRDGRKKLIQRIDTPLRFMALVVVVAEAGLLAVVGTSSGTERVVMFVTMGVILALAIAAVVFRETHKEKIELRRDVANQARGDVSDLQRQVAELESERDTLKQQLESLPEKVAAKFPLGSSEHVPLDPPSVADQWKRTWRSSWTYFDRVAQELKPYVDDTVKIEEIDVETGLLTGTALSPYFGGTTYSLQGRVSRQGFALLIYSFDENPGMVGAVIARMHPDSQQVNGWWLGFGKEDRTVGGRFTMKLATNEPFVPQIHMMPDD
ncbi:MAG: bZIP transcription factor [Actinomycetota bacterium]